MTQWLVDLVGTGALAYLVIFGVVAVDAFFPALPGETVVIVGGILAASGRLDVAAVAGAACAGALAGDHISYGLGRFVGQPITRRVFPGEGAQARLAWARRQLDERGVTIIAVARYIPGGRTSVTFSAGVVRFPPLRFLAADLVAAITWGCFATALGYFGGRAFENSFWKPLGLAFVVAIVLAGVLEGIRRMRARRIPSEHR
jgi:membrane-associated protein